MHNSSLHTQWNYSQVNAKEPHYWDFNIGSGNDLVPSVIKPMLTLIYGNGTWNDTKYSIVHFCATENLSFFSNNMAPSHLSSVENI